ncbi:unnamed protein product [Prorocentrum cordatum]|uniref:Uncharacterized protein n=1 Tax=Prorocentrum cordatum TaxID=2364126 RepID=A0ABN9SYT8_9DINO|nr:unnamed protein product [Polarella glacialis]
MRNIMRTRSRMSRTACRTVSPHDSASSDRSHGTLIRWPLHVPKRPATDVRLSAHHALPQLCTPQVCRLARLTGRRRRRRRQTRRRRRRCGGLVPTASAHSLGVGRFALRMAGEAEHCRSNAAAARGAAPYSRSPATEFASPVEAVSPSSVETSSSGSGRWSALPSQPNRNRNAGGVDEARMRRSYMGFSSTSRNVFLTMIELHSSSGEQTDKGAMCFLCNVESRCLFTRSERNGRCEQNVMKANYYLEPDRLRTELEDHE